MRFQLLGTTTLALQPQLMWAWYSAGANSFIVGDEKRAFALPVSNPTSPTPLGPPDPSPPAACNLPIPAPLLDEFLREPMHGFRFLDQAAYAGAVDEKGQPAGDILRTLLFTPDYGTFVLHPPTGAVLGLRSGSMRLLKQHDDGFEPLDQTKTKGRGVLAFAAHPTEPLIVYGDNHGAFHAHRFDPAAGKFAKATKIADKERKASRLAFANGGELLAIGGMGYLATFAYADGAFTPLHEISAPVRDFLWLNDGQLVLVNQGMHGVVAYASDANGGLQKLASLPVDGAVQQLAVSSDHRSLAVTLQSSPTVSVYGIR